MPNIPLKIIRCTNRQENAIQKKNKSIEIDLQMTMMMKLAGKDFKTAITNMLKNLKT